MLTVKIAHWFCCWYGCVGNIIIGVVSMTEWFHLLLFNIRGLLIEAKCSILTPVLLILFSYALPESYILSESYALLGLYILPELSPRETPQWYK